MPLDRDWAEFFQDDVVIKQREQGGLYRIKTDTNGVELHYQTRIDEFTHMVRDVSGEQVVASGTVYFMETPPVTLEDQLVLPDGSTPRLLMIERPREIGADADYYLAIHFGRGGG